MMTRDELLRELDHLIADAKDEHCFGESDTVDALRHVYKIGCTESQMMDENEPGRSDAEEAEAAHACSRQREARTITKGRL